MSTNSAASTACKFFHAGRRHACRYLYLPRHGFLSYVLVGLLLAPAAATATGNCVPATAPTVSIRHVHDGDTVVRSDGESIRLIGIDTPELARDGRPAETGAIIARDFLRQLLAAGTWLTIRYGEERRDRYGRLLGHLYIDGRNVQAELLAAGLATPLFIAPNLEHAACYQQATQQARMTRQGLWALPGYQPQAATSLDGNERGYRVIDGTVQRVGHSRCCIWLNLDDDVALRIDRENLPLFEGIDFEALVDNALEVRGYIYERSNQLRIHLRHPADLVIMNGES